MSSVQIVADWAKYYQGLGWHCIPVHGVSELGCRCANGAACKSPGKHPVDAQWQQVAAADPSAVNAILQAEPWLNLGVCLGPLSGIIDVEFDDEEGKATAERVFSGIKTPTFTSHRSTHRVFKYPNGFQIDSAVVKVDGLECRLGTADKGAQSVFPPSVHATGDSYQWSPGLAPWEVPLAEIPPELENLLRTKLNCNVAASAAVPNGSDNLEAHPGADEGARNSTLCRLVGKHLRANGPVADLLALATAFGDRCRPPMDHLEVDNVVQSLTKKDQSKWGGGRSDETLTLATESFANIKVEPVDWLWDSRFALGKFSLMVGEPNLGKTFVACDIAARVTAGLLFPDGAQPVQGEVLILSAEDSASDTLKPRFLAAKGAGKYFHNVTGVLTQQGEERYLDLREHLTVIENWLDSHPNARLLIVDPISAYLGGIDSHRNTEVRSFLMPLCALAARRGIAILGITHLTKNQASSINRINGSIAFVAASRATWLVTRDPNDTDRRLFVCIKNNLADIEGLAYRIVGNGTDAHVEWEKGSVPNSAGCAGGSPISEAINFLTQLLVQGPRLSKEVAQEAKLVGITKRTFDRAKKELGIVSVRRGNAWWCELPLGGANTVANPS